MSADFSPNFNTPPEAFCKEEHNKLSAESIAGNLREDFADFTRDDVCWETEQLAKSHGVYLEFDRAVKGSNKDWFYMVRFGIPAGGPITREQWNLLDSLAEEMTAGPREQAPSLRLTTRQAVQFHWVKKQHLVRLVKEVAEAGIFSLNGCGDNTRNVMACPLSRFSSAFDGQAWAKKTADYFRLPVEPFIQVFGIDPNYLRQEGESPERFNYGPNLLNRKFKIAFSAISQDPLTGELVPDNCVELRTNDLAVAPILDDSVKQGGPVTAFQIYVGGGQGERHGKPTLAALGKPFAVVSEDALLPILSAVVETHQEWGDRENRHWARLKYVVRKLGVDWLRSEVAERSGCVLEKPIAEYDPGARLLHFGWSNEGESGKATFGAFVENGRITDVGPNGRLKTMVRTVLAEFDTTVSITPNQDLLFHGIPVEGKAEFEKRLADFGYGQRNGKPYSTLRLLSGACVGRDTCRLTYTDSERFEPELLDELEALGWGEMTESIGITGCERQCFRPATKSVGLVGSGLNRYQLKLYGSVDGRYQGEPLLSNDGQEIQLRSIPRERVASVIDALFKHYSGSKIDGEDFGAFTRRVGRGALLEHLGQLDSVKDLLEKPHKAKGVMLDSQQ